MDKKSLNKKKSWITELIIFALLLLALMINDALDHPEDFIKGFNSVTSESHNFK